MAVGAPRGDFKLVLSGVNQARLQDIVAELAEVLNIDPKMASDAIANAPIVLIAGMTQQQATILRTHLLRLVKLGAKMTLGTEPVGKAKQLQWPAPPPILRRPANFFVCPSCGERFLVQRLPSIPAARPAPPPSAQAPAPEAPVAEEPVEATPVEAEPLPAEEVDEGIFAEELGEAEPGPLPAEAELLPAAPEEIPEAEALPPELEAAEVPEPEPVLEAEPILAEPFPPEPAPRLAPAKPQPAPPRPQAQPGQAKPQPKPAQPRPAPKPQPAPPAKPAPAAKPESGAAAGPRYDVSVAKVSGRKQEQLAELIAGRQGISYDDALKQCERTVVIVCRDAPPSEAGDWRKAIVAIGLEPRIRKR